MEPDRGIHRRLAIKLTDSLINRFWDSVQINEPDECWNWTSSIRSGYGAIKHAGRVFSAHRVSYVIHYGDLAHNLIVMHLCNNKACCNPKHLQAGTPLQNNRDSHLHGIKYRHGEDVWNSKLTEEIVKEIWKHRERGLGYRRISRIVGVSEKLVSNVIYGYSWKHAAPNFPERFKKNVRRQ